MQRLLVWILLVLGIIWLLRRLGGGRPAAHHHVRAVGRMVRDRVCQTFLPEEQALRLEAGGSVHYFCSATCRDRFHGRAQPLE